MENLENENPVIIQDDDLYNKKTVAVPAPERKKDIDVENTFYENIIDGVINNVLDLNSFNSLNNTAQSRNELYNVYDNMCQDGTISAVIETYSEDATERNDDGLIVWAESENAEVAKMVEYLLDTLNVDKHIFKWVYSLCKYGDLYLRLYRESEYNDELFTNSLNLFPLSAKSLNISKLALAGENKTISPFSEILFAISTACSKVLHL